MLSLQANCHLLPTQAPLGTGRIREIDSLPNELLSEIFSLVQTGWETRSWYRVLWVCRRWSAVGRAAACLWCNFTIRSRLNRPFIVASLKYSGNSPLTIILDEPRNLQEDLAKVLYLFSFHIHRIRSFSINTRELVAASDSVQATSVCFPFPSLETFEEYRGYFPPLHDRLIWKPDGSDYPHLRNLILGGSITIEVAPTVVFPSLRKLELSYSSNPAFTFRSFMEFLSRHPHLEEFGFFQYDLALDIPFANLMFPPTIRSFSLASHSKNYIKAFMSSFTHIPAHVSLSISHRYPEFEMESATDSTVSSIHMLPAPPQRHLHTLTRVTSIEITGDMVAVWTLVGRALPGDTDSLVEFEVDDPWCRPNSFPAPRELVTATQIFKGSPVTDIRLTGNIVGAVPKAEWIVLFDAFPLLEHVAIEEVVFKHHEDAREGLLEALLEHPPDGGPRWPRLRRFTLICQDCTAPFTSLLPRALQVRAEQGAKVEQLRFFAVRTPWELDDDEESEVMDELVPWFEAATWKKFVDDARLDLVLTYT